MVQDPSSAGGSAIYKDGDPVSVQLAAGESVTVPTGETWILEVNGGGTGGDNGEFQINGNSATGFDGDSYDASTSASIVATDGDSLKAYDSGASGVKGFSVSGWSV